MKSTLARRIKLLPDEKQKSFLRDYFLKFSRAVNFGLKVIPILRAEYDFIPKAKQVEGECGQCGEHQILTHKFKTHGFFVCLKCYSSRVGKSFIRKTIYAARGRKRGKYDVRDAVTLPGTEYAAAIGRAVDTIEAGKKQQAVVKRQIKYTERKLCEWTEVLGNQEIVLENREKVGARVVLPRVEKQRMDRYRHYFHDERSKGKTEMQIARLIKSLENTANKLKQRFNSTHPKFNGSIVDLWNSAIKDINEEFVELSVGGGKEKVPIERPRAESGRIWLREVIASIKDGKPTYPLLQWITVSGAIYLQYPVVTEIKDATIQKNSRVMGIDRGVNQIAVSVVIDNPKDSPHHIRFYSGKGLLRTKIKYQLIKKKMTGAKNVNRRRAKFGNKVLRVSKNLLHNISRQIVDEDKELQPIVISLEDLKIIQGEKRPKRGNAIRERRTRFMLSNFTYSTLQNYIEYKASLAGIPVRYVRPEYTSQICYKCGVSGKRTKGFFECFNSACGNKINSDLNGALNVANNLYKEVEM